MRFCEFFNEISLLILIFTLTLQSYNILKLAKRIADYIKSTDTYVLFSELEKDFIETKYLLPGDIKELTIQLKKENINFLFDENGQLSQLSKQR